MDQLLNVLYWLALSAWFGAAMFLAIASPVILRRLREANPILPDVLSVNLEGQHGTLLAGTIVADLVRAFRPIQLIAAGLLAGLLVVQWVVMRGDETQMVMLLVRSALYVAAVAMLMYDWRLIWPRLLTARQTYIDHADEPDIANEALDQFDRHSIEGVTVLRNSLILLLGLVLLSASSLTVINRTVTPEPPDAAQSE